jgi:hypothetical protein
LILSPQAIEQILESVRSDAPQGYKRFYEVVHNTTVPDHALRWIEAAYSARSHSKGALIEAFAGSTKTTTLATLYAYQIGLYPHKANLHVGPNDKAVADTIGKVADIIQNNAGFKLCFPHVVPDAALGFSASGYEVRVTEDVMPYADWRRLNSARRDPTLLSVTYTARDLPGRHPDGVMGMDDLDNDENTTSQREHDRLRDILQGTIFARIVPSQTWIWYIGTPWNMEDTIHYLQSTGRFEHARTPVTKDGTETGEPMWAEKFGPPQIQEQKELMGSIKFARTMLLNLDLAKGINLKAEWLHKYPHSEIDPSWPRVMGVDYASTSDKSQTKRDYFCIAVGAILPGGGVVLEDGIRGHFSQGEAEAKLNALAAMYPTLNLIGVEAIGKGEEFYSLMLRSSSLPVIPCHTGKRAKGDRFELQMAPLFEFSRAWISSAETPFIKAFSDEWVSWPNGEHDDALDAVYYMLAVAQGELSPRPRKATLPSPWYDKQKQTNPYAALGRR